MGDIFLRRKMRPKAEVINDYGRDVSNPFRILQRHYPQFMNMMRFQITTRIEFNRLVDTNPETLTDLERAARFLYVQRLCFGGKISERHFGVAKEPPARFNLTTLKPMLEDLHSRLSGVIIECLDYAQFIPRYDGPNTLFYLDPPYFGCENDYGKGLFSRADFEKMAEILSGIKGRFILSINDVQPIRETFANFRITPVRTTYTIGSNTSGSNDRKELLAANYKIS